jgi:hypothetical protein
MIIYLGEMMTWHSRLSGGRLGSANAAVVQAMFGDKNIATHYPPWVVCAAASLSGDIVSPLEHHHHHLSFLTVT